METTSQTLKSLENWTTKALNKVKILNKSHWLNFLKKMTKLTGWKLFADRTAKFPLKALCTFKES